MSDFQMRRLLIGVGVLLVVLGVALAIVYGKLGYLIKRGVDTYGPPIVGTDVSLGSANVSIFSGEGSLGNLRVGNPEGYSKDQAFDLGKIAIAVDPKSVTGKVIHVRSLVIDSPRLLAEFDPAGKSNLDKIMEHVRAAAGGGSSGGGKGSGSSSPPPKLIVDEFRFENGEVRALAPSFKVDKTVKIPSVVLKNLGAKEGGATPAQLADEIMRPIISNAVHAAEQEYLGAQKDKLKDKAKEKLMDRLFGK